MMKRFVAALLALLMLCMALPVTADDAVPDKTCFSPGLALMEEAVANGGVEITARFTPDAMLSVNKNALAVLQALFGQASLVYRMNSEQEQAQLYWNDAPLADLSLARQDDGVTVSGSVLPFSIKTQDEAQLYYLLGMHAGIAQMAADSALVTPVHLNLPSVSGETLITQEAVDALAGEGDLPALTVVQPIALTWTANENGVLTKANIEGAVRFAEHEAPWVIDLAAWGGASKMSLEGTLIKDERNKLDLAVSITYATNKATRKEKAGHDVDMRVKLSGKLGGYTKTLSATLKGSDRWARAEETGVLEETIKQSVSITYTDKDPEASKANTANISVSIKDNGTVRSGGDLREPQSDFKTTVLVEIGQYKLLEGTLNASMRALEQDEAVIAARVEDEAEIALLEELSEEQLFELREVMGERIVDLMETMYPSLDAKTIKKIKNDL